MHKWAFWHKDWLLGLLVSVAFMLASGSELMQSLERKAYDLALLASDRTPSDRIAVIAIDEQSIANLGRWPWPREIHAQMIDLLAAGQVKVIGHTAFFFEPQLDAGLPYLYRIAALLGKSSEAQAAPDALDLLLQEAFGKLESDKKLAASMARANDVVLALHFELGETQGKPDSPLPDYVRLNSLTNIRETGTSGALPARAVLAPIPLLGGKALALGHLNSLADVDGAVRTEALVLNYYDQYYPSLSLMLAAKSLNLGPADIQVNLGESVQLGSQKIATDPSMQMHGYYYKDKGGRAAFTVDSFYDVYSGKIAADKYRDKIVLIGATAAGVGALQVTPISPGMAPVLTLAHSVSSLLKGDFFVTPVWGGLAKLGAVLLVAAYLGLLLPRLGAAAGAACTAAFFAALLSTHVYLMTVEALWLQLMLPAALLLTGHLLLTTKRFFLTEKGQHRADQSSWESNRLLGLAFQGQGQLDMAFDKFRNVRRDDSLMEVLYNLGLDFERKRQFNKAESVFNYMAEYNPKFRDLEQRLSRAHQMSETVILAGASVRSNESLELGRQGVARPMLGRYAIEKEIGKGAMGAVYLGRDSKIGRLVAIKTLALAQEFEADELQDVKQRFFREAETAGRLNHPNIVTIHDAGEEHDLAYIAMEYLKGCDLSAYTKPDKLLPLPVLIGIVARVADALDYAHKQNVVHRDIKPANIMYDPQTDTPKVTDFGIARITDSSRTRTGMVLGTPSFMSPEQLAGQKIQGSSDLYSLGASLYQLSCGKLPFQGNSMAQLMYRIANEAHTDILTIRPDLPPCLVAIINKSLAKKNEDRFVDGAEMAKALRLCAASLQG